MKVTVNFVKLYFG